MVEDMTATGFQHKGLELEEISSILGDTIIHHQPPFVVGIFGKWNSGKTQLLHSTREKMEEFTKFEDKSEFKISIISFLYRLLFFNPILDSTQKSDIKYIFVQFSLLDYAGCDQMWAGILSHISNVIDDVLGKWVVKMFRSWNYNPKNDLSEYLVEEEERIYTNKQWKRPPFKVFVKPIFIVVLLAATITLWVVFGVPSVSSETEKLTSDILTIFLSSGIGFAVALQLKNIFKMVTNLAKSQAQKVGKLAKKSDFSKSLGFLGKVKTEISYITSVVRYCSVVLDKNLRICIIIDDIDLLSKQQIMNLFQIVSLLHNSPNSPYVQILCMDPTIAANLIKKALTEELYSMISGYAFLNKHIQLPFYIPLIDYKKKVTQKRNRMEKKNIPRRQQQTIQQSISQRNYDRERGLLAEASPVFESDEPRCSFHVDRLQENCLFTFGLAPYIDGNQRALKRVLTSSKLAINLMLSKASKRSTEEETKNLVAWITFVDQWPYRLCWIRQVVEDNIQLHRIDESINLISGNALLRDVYHLVEVKLTEPKDWRSLLDLDNDPELFVNFLKQFPFTVSDMTYFLPYTTNLNNSLRRIIAKCSAADYVLAKSIFQFSIDQAKWHFETPIKEWTVEDVCKQLESMDFNEKDLTMHQRNVREQKVDGSRICQSSKMELEELLGMPSGQWRKLWLKIKLQKVLQSITEKS